MGNFWVFCKTEGKQCPTNSYFETNSRQNVIIRNRDREKDPDELLPVGHWLAKEGLQGKFFATLGW